MAEESSHRPRNTDHADVYPEFRTKATPALHQEQGDLRQKITTQIQNKGPIPFSEFMALALYDPESGYYAKTRQKTGKQGDFITSVSVGPCFGKLLAQRLFLYWQTSGSPASFRIIEPGAHDGTLAADILTESSGLSPKFFDSIHYHLIETSAYLREQQHSRLEENYHGKFTTHASLDAIDKGHGAVISNELIDAFPVELIQFSKGKWHQLMVGLDEKHNFTFIQAPLAAPELQELCNTLGASFPEGYTTEHNTGISSYTKEVGRIIESGLLLTIDYGHLQDDYYHPARTTGTLQTYHKHQKAENPLLSPGELDITAHVNFSQLQAAAEDAGFKKNWFGTQASYLTQYAREWLLAMEQQPDPSHPELIRQFQTLTHPSMLGSKFSVLEMQK